MDILDLIQKDRVKLHNQIQNIKDELKNIYKDIDEKLNCNDYNNHVFILEDFKQILNSIIFLDYVCGGSFKLSPSLDIPYWNFEKNIFIELNVLVEKLLKLNKYMCKNNDVSSNSDIKVKIINILEDDYLKETKELRNKIEHGIDPYIYEEFFKITNEFEIERIFIVLKGIYEVFIESINSNNKIFKNKNNFKGIEEYTNESKDVLKKSLEELNDINLEIWMYTKIYKKYIEKIKNTSQLSENEKDLGMLIYDMTFKYMTLHKSLLFSLGNIKMNRINNMCCFESSYYKENIVHKYFTKVSLNMIYSIYEKIGVFLIESLDLNIPQSYFKSVIKYICESEIKKDEWFIRNVNKLKESDEYKLLNDIRQANIHGDGHLKYEKYMGKVSTLLIKNMIEIQQVIKYVNEYFINILDDKMNININENDFKNANKYCIEIPIEINNF